MKYEYEKSKNRTLTDNADDSPLVKELKSERIYTVTFMDNNSSDPQQELNNDYIVLEYSDWTIDSDKSLFVKDLQMIGITPKTILVIIDGVITQYNIEETVGKMIGYKHVGLEERQRIIKAYNEWKEKR